MPQLLFLRELLLPSACRCPFHCEVSFHTSSDRCLDCLLQSFDSRQRRLRTNHHRLQKLQVTHTMAVLSLPVFMAAKEHMKSKAVQLESFSLPSRLLQSFSSGSQCTPEHFFSLLQLICTTAALHAPRECQCGDVCEGGKWNLVSYFIGGRGMHSNLLFFILNCAFWKQAAIEHTHTTAMSWGGDGGIDVNIRQSHVIKPSQAFLPVRYNHLVCN